MTRMPITGKHLAITIMLPHSLWFLKYHLFFLIYCFSSRRALFECSLFVLNAYSSFFASNREGQILNFSTEMLLGCSYRNIFNRVFLFKILLKLSPLIFEDYHLKHPNALTFNLLLFLLLFSIFFCIPIYLCC